MKIHYRIAAVALMLCFAVQANAQHFGSNYTQASVGATIVAPLVVTKTADMNFGSIIVNDFIADITLHPDGNLSSHFGEATFLQSSGATAASFTVTGADLAYSIFIPMGMTFLENGTGDLMHIMQFIDSKNGSSMVSSGSDSFTVGAVLHVPPMVSAGVYTGSFEVFVNYQ